MRKLLVLGLILSLAGSAGAVEKKRRPAGYGMFLQRLALSTHLGGGFPTGDFSNSSLGNAQVGLVGNMEVEYYFTDGFSLGFGYSGGWFDDEDFSDFSSWVNNYQAFGRFVVPTGGRVRPYGRFGLGVSALTYKEELPVGTLYSNSDPGVSLAFGGGMLFRASNLVSVNLGMGYDVLFLDDSEVEDTGFIVGYDPSYFSILFGLSFYLQP
ncbi:MAG: porin family protein [candidate division Zixibacteria bacterium]|nr:porin family protein [candidate division Zixibacteria bacterium]